MTLVELLVVVTIGVLLLATAVPLMRPAIEDSQLRESSRQLNVLCAMAKARAREINRPVGISIERSAPGSNAAFEVHLAESPPNYSGDFVDALADLVDNGGSGIDGFASEIWISKTESASLYIATDVKRSLAKVGDLIQFDHKGPRYQITGIAEPTTPSTHYRVFISVPSGVSAPAATAATFATIVAEPGVPYTVFRQPLKSPMNSVQLGGGSVIDLEYSGIGVSSTPAAHPGDAFFDSRYTSVTGNLNDQPVVIMFDPGGFVSRVYTRFYNSFGTLTYGGQRANGTIYLLIGKFEQTTVPPVLPTTPTAAPNNLQDLSSIWLAVGASTGTVTSAENLGGTTLAAAREIARSAQAMGGK